jgi:anti-sigma B factor antagonist
MFEVEKHGDVTFVVPTEEFGAANDAEAKAFLKDVIDHGARRIVVDLSPTEFLDSAGLGVLLSAMKGARAVGGTVRLCSLTENLKTILRLTRLERVFDIYPDREQADTSW